MKTPRYPIGEQDFAKIRETGSVYIDKTAIIYELVNSTGYVFLSRPRRFGKSLLLSTLRYYFEGRKDLFEGLKIMELEKEWRKHPVLHLEMSRVSQQGEDALLSSLEQQLGRWETLYGLEPKGLEPAQRFAEIIIEAHHKTGERVVILIDEYDNPLINTLDRKGVHEINRDLLKSVYSNLKALDEHIRFGMVTGITRFSHTSIFSGINNLKDISLDPRYDTICGFTLKEIERNLLPGVERLAEGYNCSPNQALELLKKEYDGYHFSENLVDIFNPFSLLYCLDTSKISNYWISSGVPEFLIKNLKSNKIELSKLFKNRATLYQLATPDASFRSPIALLFQTGYLTIKGYDPITEIYDLGTPNREIDQGLSYLLLDEYTRLDNLDARIGINEMAQAWIEGRPEEALSRLKSLLAAIPQGKRKISELVFERTFFTIFHILGFHIHTEISTSNGRLDILMETKDYIYILELKLDKSAEEALQQIERKEYDLPWKHDGRKIFKIGINFSSRTRNIDGWIVKEEP